MTDKEKQIEFNYIPQSEEITEYNYHTYGPGGCIEIDEVTTPYRIGMEFKLTWKIL